QVRFVISGRLGLDSRPQQIDPDGVEANGGHRLECSVERLGAHPPRPVRPLHGDEVGANGEDGPSGEGQVVGPSPRKSRLSVHAVPTFMLYQSEGVSTWWARAP